MYIQSATIEGIRSVRRLTWKCPADVKFAGWHVILGDNGAGKSSFLRAISLLLTGPKEAPGLRQDWDAWMRRDFGHSSIRVDLDHERGADHWAGQGRTGENFYLRARLDLDRGDSEITTDWTGDPDPKRHVWSGKDGWFSAAFGPFRRFAGGEANHRALFYSHPRLARHLSVFGEDVALSECLEWLRQLKHEKLESGDDNHLLDRVQRFVNESELLPQGARIAEVTAKGVRFVDGNDCNVPVEELSDGFRSILSLTFELIRQMAQVYGDDNLFDETNPTAIAMPGVVLIDEIDAHLHPVWQRRIGPWFCQHFPKVQFFVTTHSPIICQAAEHGTVYRLPTPGTDEKGGMITGDELNRLIHGNIADAYATGVFGIKVARSPSTQRMLARLAELNQLELGGKLTALQRREQTKLRATFPTTPHSLAPLST